MTTHAPVVTSITDDMTASYEDHDGCEVTVAAGLYRDTPALAVFKQCSCGQDNLLVLPANVIPVSHFTDWCDLDALHTKIALVIERGDYITPSRAARIASRLLKQTVAPRWITRRAEDGEIKGIKTPLGWLLNRTDVVRITQAGDR